jgi:hypothetical protein
MRDLRAIDRMLRSNRTLWTAWTSDVRNVAGNELSTLAEFVGTLRPGDATLIAAG